MSQHCILTMHKISMIIMKNSKWSERDQMRQAIWFLLTLKIKIPRLHLLNRQRTLTRLRSLDKWNRNTMKTWSVRQETLLEWIKDIRDTWAIHLCQVRYPSTFLLSRVKDILNRISRDHHLNFRNSKWTKLQLNLAWWWQAMKKINLWWNLLITVLVQSKVSIMRLLLSICRLE